jgi:hypothetical protein
MVFIFIFYFLFCFIKGIFVIGGILAIFGSLLGGGDKLSKLKVWRKNIVNWVVV